MALFIFDCDGTIADSQHMIVAAMTEAFRIAELETPRREDIVQVIGLSLEHAVRQLLPESQAQRASNIAEDYKGAFRTLRASGHPDEPLFPGMKSAIATLLGTSAQLGIATGKSRRGVRMLLEREGLSESFVTVQTADTHPSKPHPSMIEAAMMDTGSEPHETVMIGDTTFDMAMAHNAGVAAVGVGWGYHSNDMLKDAGAHTVCQDAAGLLAVLKPYLPEAANIDAT